MGQSTTSNNKATTTAQGGEAPAWAAPGTDQYNQMNQLLQTGPMAAANQTIAQGGVGATGQQAIGDLMGGGAAQDYLTPYARGDFVGGSPYLDDIISKGAGDIATQTNQMFASGGRYGSGANQGVLSDSVADYANQLRYQDYNQQQQNQLGAANALEASQQGRALGAAGLENQGFSNMLGMIQQLPTIQGNKIFDAQQQQQVGSQIDQRSQQQLNDLINQWTQSDMEPWARLGGLISAATGSAGPYGQQTSTTTGSQSSGLGGILGGIGSLLGAFL